MTRTIIEPNYVGGEAITKLCAHVGNRHSGRLVTLVADSNTYAAAGEAVHTALRDAGISTHLIALRAKDLHADESSLARVLTSSPLEDSVFLAVGSGTITDITRYISFRLGVPFIAFPTASSVDGFASGGCPLVIDGIKRTYYARPPEAIFADSGVLAAAPPELTAAGLGDLLGKTTAIADWRLGAQIRGEPFDEEIAARVTAAVNRCMPVIDSISRRDPAGLRTLFDSLTETGLCMIDFGDSQPASGAEHHVSHVWEMIALQKGAHAALHGIQVGIATEFVAGIYETIRSLDVADVRKLLRKRLPLSRDTQEREIRTFFGPLAESVVSGHREFLDLTEEQQLSIADRVIEYWPDIQVIAASVPPPESIKRSLEMVGAPTGPGVPGMPERDVEAGTRGGHYLRSRFTAAKLAHMLGIQGA
ncbi:MAG: iron-containing alcohol dehydrogenase [Spirochaetaceae bacterium]|nr:MAG: iron-containing alcohol dehydrogenase [Spirochaetaceae bacterium]